MARVMASETGRDVRRSPKKRNGGKKPVRGEMGQGVLRSVKVTWGGTGLNSGSVETPERATLKRIYQKQGEKKQRAVDNRRKPSFGKIEGKEEAIKFGGPMK